MEANQKNHWAVQAVAEMCKLFGVGSEWSIGVNFADNPGGSDTWDAAADTDSEYLHATIEVKSDMPKTPDNIQLMAHEVLHIALAENRAVFLRAINSLSGSKSAKDEMLARWEYSENRTIQRISRAVLSASDTSVIKKTCRGIHA